MKIEEALYEEVIYEKKFPKWEMPSDEELAEDKVDADEPKERLTFEQIMEKIYFYVFSWRPFRYTVWV